MNFKYILLIGICILGMSFSSSRAAESEKKVGVEKRKCLSMKKTFFANLGTVASSCALSVKALLRQPLFNGEGPIYYDKSKILHLPSYTLARVHEIIHRNATKNMPKGSYPHVSAFGCGNNQLYSAQGEHIPQGIIMPIYSDTQDLFSHELVLASAYESVIKKLSEGWELVDHKKHPDILHKPEDPADCYLLLKKSLINEEDVLFRCLASELNLSGDDCSCSDTWEDAERGYKSTDMLYLWVAKRSFVHVADVLRIKIPTEKLLECDERDLKDCHSIFPLKKLP